MAIERLCNLIQETKDGDWGQENPTNNLMPYLIIRGTDFDDAYHGKLGRIPTRYLEPSSAERRTLQANDILIETAGGTKEKPTGKVTLITNRIIEASDLPLSCASFARFIRIDEGKANPRYIFWFLRNMYEQGEMWQHQVQHTGIARFQYTRFSQSQDIHLPPKLNQKAIAHILGTLDDKIELHRSMNDTLEAMARALFKSWFVDFDPVRKKAEGQPTGLPPEMDALFPDSFDDSELGQIPKGWKVGTIGVYSTAVNEQVFPAEMDGTEIYVGLEHLPRKSITLTEWDKSENVQSNKSKFMQEDVLFGKLRPYFHKVVFAPVDGLCSTDILVIRSRSKEAKSFILMHLSSVEVIEYATGFSNGTKMPRTNWKDLSNFKIVSPPQKLLSKYETIAAEKLSQLKYNTTESSVLVSIRDSLLPKLISSDLDLSDQMIKKILEPIK